jgi:hypothetical protein
MIGEKGKEPEGGEVGEPDTKSMKSHPDLQNRENDDDTLRCVILLLEGTLKEHKQLRVAKKPIYTMIGNGVS